MDNTKTENSLTKKLQTLSSGITSNFDSIGPLISNCSPIILPVSILLFTIYNNVIQKSLIYLAIVVGILCVRFAYFYTSGSTSQIASCGDGVFKGINYTVSSYIISFTFFYLCMPMFYSSSINVGIVSTLLFYLFFDIVFKFI